jgi:4-hydroxybenzoate polyprenyltransferase
VQMLNWTFDLAMSDHVEAEVSGTGTDPAPCEACASSSPIDKPICVDLDGTLILTDTLIESFLSVVSRREGLLRLPHLLTWRRAAFKQKLGELTALNPALLPYNIPLIEFLQKQKSDGRRLVLVTAADEQIARLIADHLGFFDEVIASNGVVNLKGKAKANEMVRRFGRNGFDYAGNSRADLPVWREAKGIIIVNATNSVARAARRLGPVTSEFPQQPSRLSNAIRAMRPYQWVKNLLVFVPLLTSQSFTDWQGLKSALVLFMSFCVMASGVYVANDLVDLNADRQHPRKRKRPFASGTLPLGFGIGLAAALLFIGLGLATLVSAAPLVLLYAAISMAYSLMLKQLPLVDVFILAALYTLRVVAGGVASQHPVTLWLLGFSGFTFLSLALIKRCGELPRDLAQPSNGAGHRRRGYFPGDRPLLVTFGVASTFASSVVLALFVGATLDTDRYHSPELLWGLVPLILFWQCRLWLGTERGYMHDDPIVYAFRDWVSWLTGMAAVAIIVLASWVTLRF